MWYRGFIVFSWVLSSLALASPATADLFPKEAPPGATVTISGTDFGTYQSPATNRVTFNGVPALVQRWEADLIRVKVPLNAATGPVLVRSGEDTFEVGDFVVQTPKIRRIVPEEAEPGSVIQILGDHFGTTAGSRDPNTMFGVNEVEVNGIRAEIRKWRDDKIEAIVPANAKSGKVVLKLASSDPLPNGSCCAPVEYAESNAVPITIIPSIAMDPHTGPVGTKVVLFGQAFGETKGKTDAVLFNGHQATVAKWSDSAIVVHVPLNATSGPVVLTWGGNQRNLGTFEVTTPAITDISPKQGPIGTRMTIIGRNFGDFAEGGSTPYFADFQTGQNGVEIGGVPAIVYRWQNDRIDVWIPYSAKSGVVTVKRGGTIPKPDGSCCQTVETISAEGESFTIVTPKVESFSPKAAGLDEIITIKGSGFGAFLKTTEPTQPGLNEGAHSHQRYRLGENVSRSEVLINGVATVVVSWTDTEIRVSVPRRPVFGIGNPKGFDPSPTTGPLVVRRGSWDLLPDGSCCTEKRWVSAVAGEFTVLKRGLPDQTYYTIPNPRRD